MAPGRGVSHNPWRETLLVASRGPGRQCPGYSCAEPPRSAKAAKRFFRKLLKGLQYVPRVLITDKLRSYGAAKREILPGVEHRQHKGLNNRAENSHQPTRLREKKCGASSQPNKPNAFSPLLVLSLAISSRAGTVCVLGNTVPFYRPASRLGMR